MKTIARAFSVIAIAAIAATLAACSGGVSSPSPTPTGPLLTLEARGGLCVDGLCRSVMVIERDGRVHAAAKPPNDLGTVPPDQLVALETAINATDFTVLRSHPFTGICPAAYDGQELIFEFGTATGLERVSTCEVAVDFGDPLFVAVSAALGPFAPIPTT